MQKIIETFVGRDKTASYAQIWDEPPAIVCSLAYKSTKKARITKSKKHFELEVR